MPNQTRGSTGLTLATNYHDTYRNTTSSKRHLIIGIGPWGILLYDYNKEAKGLAILSLNTQASIACERLSVFHMTSMGWRSQQSRRTVDCRRLATGGTAETKLEQLESAKLPCS